LHIDHANKNVLLKNQIEYSQPPMMCLRMMCGNKLLIFSK